MWAMVTLSENGQFSTVIVVYVNSILFLHRLSGKCLKAEKITFGLIYDIWDEVLLWDSRFTPKTILLPNSLVPGGFEWNFR